MIEFLVGNPYKGRSTDVAPSLEVLELRAFGFAFSAAKRVT